MSPPPVSFDTEELLAQISWVHQLARRVVSDAHVAEDLTQDAMLIALRAPRSERPEPGRTASLRRWLASVVRNLGRTRCRSRQRRAERESAFVHQDLPPSTLELIERAAVQRELVGALLALDEPYRSTLLMRFFEDLSQREIAERMRVPVSTVGTRIAEGIQRLRRKFGGRETWLSSILAAFRWPQEALLPAAIHGAVVMSIQSKLILGGAVLTGAFFAFRCVDSGPPADAEPNPALAAVVEQAVLDDDTPVAIRRESVELEEEPPEVKAHPAGFYDIPEHAGIKRAVARGMVIDLSDTPVGGVEVCRRRARGFMEGSDVLVTAPIMERVTSDAAGRFEIEGVLPFELTVEDDYYTNVFQGVVHDEGDGETLVVVAPRIPLGGVVVDEEGARVSDVIVTVQPIIPQRGRRRGSSVLVIPEARTDEFGAFEVKDAAAVDEAQIQFRAPGFAMLILPVPEGGDAAMHVVLSRESESLYTITGHVVLEDGSPAVGAHVSTGVLASPTDEKGYFVIDFEPWLKFRVDEDAPTVVTAIKPGLRPVSLTLPSVNEARESGWPEEIVLELVGEPLTIRGTVLDEEGDPVPGLLVEPSDMSEFGTVSMAGMPAFSGMRKTQEQLAGGGEATTDQDGRFELKGLLDRSYSICVYQRPSLLCVVTDPVDAGDQDVRIVFDRGTLGTIAGRIVDRHGAAIAGVRIAVSRTRSGGFVIGRNALTDENGYFSIANVTTEPEFLRIEGEAIVPELFRQLSDDDDVAALRLEVGRRCRAQFDWGDWPGRDDKLHVVNDDGEELMMMIVGGGRMGEVPSVAFQERVTDVILVSDAATHAIVYRDGEEVRRFRLDLKLDELNLIQL